MRKEITNNFGFHVSDLSSDWEVEKNKPAVTRICEVIDKMLTGEIKSNDHVSVTISVVVNREEDNNGLS